MMTGFDIGQARTFIELLHGDAEQPQYFQVFHDSKTSQDALNTPMSFYANLDDSIEYFNAVNAHNYGIYITLNKTDGRGREEHNIVGYRVLFADLDNQAMPEFDLEPHFITQRDATHSHCYWLVNGIVTDDQFRRLQRKVALSIGSDTQVTDPARVVRLAGSYNCKDHTNHMMYNIVKVAEDLTPNTLAEVEAGFPIDEETEIKLEQWCGSRNALTEGEDYNDNPIYRERLIKWLHNAEPAVQGSGTLTLIKVIGMARDLGIPLIEAQDLAWEHYNPRCIPVWEERERTHFNDVVTRAYKYANNGIGCRTAASSFLRAGVVPEPTGGWEHNRTLGSAKKTKAPTPEIPLFGDTADSTEVFKGRFLSARDGAILKAKITNKSSIWDLANTFIANVYPDGGLVRKGKISYKYMGTHWDEITDETMFSKIMYFFSTIDETCSFAVSKIKNIHEMVNGIIHSEVLERDIWLDESFDGQYTLSFNNTLVEMKDEIKLMDHTREYFSRNNLGYDYNPDADCKEWIAFLESVWGKGSPFIGSLQEAFGYALTTDCSLHKIILLIGKARAGKSVITSVLSKILGEHNIASPSLESIIEHSTVSSMAKAKAILIAEATDLHQSIRMRVLGRLKAISGGDGIDYHEMYKGVQHNSSWGKIFMTANTMPQFDDPSGALAARFWTFPFTISFEGREDRTLLPRLTKPESIAGIMNWSIRGLERLQANGMKPTIISEALEIAAETKRDMFPLADFVDDCCVVENGATVTNADLYKAYQYYTKQNDVKYQMSANKFGKVLKSSYLPVNPYRFPLSESSKRARGMIGLKLTDVLARAINPNVSNVVNMPAVAAPVPVSKTQ